MSSGGYRLELNPIESFSFFCKTLWCGDLPKRFYAQIPDTIVYFRGRPQSWYFTSQKTGEVLRKKADKMHSVASIVEVFKQKSRTFPGHRPSSMRQKVAIVWYMQSEREVASYIVDDQELGSLLSSTLKEVLAVQVYYGGNPARGNGVFEHKMWPQRNGSTKHVTSEYIDESYEFNLAQFTAQGRKITVLDHLHDVLTQFSHNVCRNVESQFVCRVASLSVTVVFTNSWVPVLVNARDIVLEGLSSAFLDNREALLFFEGEAPRLPPINEMSTVLPLRDPALSALRKVDAQGLVDSRQTAAGPRRRLDDRDEAGSLTQRSGSSQQSLQSDRRRPKSASALRPAPQKATSFARRIDEAADDDVFDVLHDYQPPPRAADDNERRVEPPEGLVGAAGARVAAVRRPQLSIETADVDDVFGAADDGDDEHVHLMRQTRRRGYVKTPEPAEIALGYRQSLRQTQTVDALLAAPPTATLLRQQEQQAAASPGSVRRLHMPTNASQQVARIGLQKRIHRHFVDGDGAALDDADDADDGAAFDAAASGGRPGSPSHYAQTHHASNGYSLNHLAGHPVAAFASTSRPTSPTARARSSDPPQSPGSPTGRSATSGAASASSGASHAIHIPKNAEEANDGSRRGLDAFLLKRRPISAPHHS